MTSLFLHSLYENADRAFQHGHINSCIPDQSFAYPVRADKESLKICILFVKSNKNSLDFRSTASVRPEKPLAENEEMCIIDGVDDFWVTVPRIERKIVMKHALVRLTGLLIVLMLVLTGCNLIGIDPIMQLDEDFAKLEKKYSGVVASYEGGEIKQADVMASLNSQYSYMSQLYSMYGLSMSSDVLESVEQTVVEGAVQDVAIARQMEALGLTLDEEKLAEIQAETDEHYQEAYDSFYATATGDTEEEKVKRTEYELAVSGYTREAIYNIEIAEANAEVVEQAVRDAAPEVTDEDLKAAYEDKVSEDEETYAESLGDFESAMTSEDEIVCWMPEGYRTVKHILLIPDQETVTAFTTARTAYDEAQSDLQALKDELDALEHPDDDADEADEADEVDEADEESDPDTDDAEAEPRTAEEIQADIEAAETSVASLQADLEKAEADCTANVQDRLDEVYAKIEAGDDFGALIEAYGEDPGMQNEPTKTRGYYVSADSVNWDAAFTKGAMALENVGDITTTPVVSGSGVHIIRYESDVTAGAVPYEQVQEALREETVETKKDEYYDTQLESWIEALNPEYHLDAFDLSED